ncbi:hypothetical protein J2N86_13285 [Legionella lytica]|uniref:Uncharacterized protein n=1 Tax=Legionella lytica TaxID=96232 RepID=A0ABY4Y7L8_9GAMM|nr:hypothetical protein [Legionella lytica]USQ13635.1 hypothetical protein J2N86_13285 [Legionella lytica]
MQMTIKDQNKLIVIYAPLLVLIACFIVIVLSISPSGFSTTENSVVIF